jgi:acyl-CoA synthetase (AMP-forming)/AMP-acid ligase II
VAEVAARTRPGDWVLTIAPSCTEYVDAFFSCLMVQCIPVTLRSAPRLDYFW